MNNLLLACLSLYIFSLVFLSKKYAHRALFVSGSILNISAIFYNWYLIGRPPFGNLPQVMVVMGACFFPIYLIMVVHKKMERLSAYFPIVSALSIILALNLKANVLWHQSPALQSAWFIPHVVSYIISYSLATIAFLVGIKYDKASHRLLRYMFPIMSFGLISGAIWADNAWGSYWSWSELKEVWALITWTLYVIYFQSAKIPKMRRYKMIPHALAFLALITTFLLVNLLPKIAGQLHSYK